MTTRIFAYVDSAPPRTRRDAIVRICMFGVQGAFKHGDNFTIEEMQAIEKHLHQILNEARRQARKQARKP